MSNLTELMSRELNTENPIERPTCITIYAILIFILGGGISLLMVIAGIITILSKPLNGLVLLILGIMFIALYILLAIGLWQLRKWSRKVVIVLQSIGIILSLIRIIITTSITATDTSGNIVAITTCGLIVTIIISGIIIIWFVNNGKYFTK